MNDDADADGTCDALARLEDEYDGAGEVLS